MKNIKEIPTNKIKPYWKNPRKNHDVEGIKQSIQKYGLGSLIAVDKNNVIILGHGRYKALVQLGYEKIPCIVLDIDEKKAKEYRITDNKLAENSQWEDEYLREELMDIKPVGFTDKEIDKLLDLDYEPVDFSKETETDIERWQKDTNKEKIKFTCPKCYEEFEVNKNDILKT
jgi:ParB-like chromosome segregation protein Spo0J